MTSFPAKERIEAALRLEKPDRVPVVPTIDLFAGRYGGVPVFGPTFEGLGVD